MKKVLIITYYWPPSGGPGVQRTLYFAKYLRDYGWEPIIFTMDSANYPVLDENLYKEIPKGIKVIKCKSIDPYLAYKKIFSFSKDKKLNTNMVEGKSSIMHKLAIWVRGNFFIPDARMLWIKPSVKFLLDFLNNNSVDIIFSSSPPQSVHLIAQKLHEKTNIPWVADFRDPWTRISYFDKLMLSKRAKNLHHKLELKVLKTASGVIAVTKTLVQDFKSICQREVNYISNGYDDERKLPRLSLKKEKFVISYVGSLDESRNPLLLWKALSSICQEDELFNKSLELRFAGRISPSIFQSLENNNLKEYLIDMGYLSHEEVYKLYKSSNVLLLIGIPNDPCILTGKIFEYLQSGRPILSISPKNGDIEELLDETNAGLNADFDELTKIKSNILSIWEKYSKDKQLDCSDSSNELISKYSRRNLTKKLATFFDEIIS